MRDVGARYELAGDPEAIAIPDTLQGSLLSRLDRLAPAVKEIAQVAAVIGRDFDQGLLAVVTGRSEAELEPTLEALIAEDIILPAPARGSDARVYRFRHALIQEIAYHSLLLARRRRFHRQVAEALEAGRPDVVEAQPELVAHNFAQSDTPARAIDYWRRAAERVFARAAYQEAIAQAARGLRLVEALPASERDRAALGLLLVRGEAEHGLGNRQSIDTFQRAVKIARVQRLPSELAQAALGFDKSQVYLEGSGQAAITLLDEALVAIGAGESVERCRVLSRLACTLHIVGSFDRATKVARQAVKLARRLDDCQGLLEALMCELMRVGARGLPIGEFPRRQQILDELTTVAERLGDCFMIGTVSARCLTAWLEIGDFERFEQALERYQQVLPGAPDLTLTWIAAGAQAMRAIHLGDFDTAERKALESQQLAEGVDVALADGIFGMQMFTIRREQGRLAEVAPLIKRFVDEHPEDAAWRPGLMLIASDLGFDAQARRILDQMAESAFSIPTDSKRLVTWTYFAEVATRLGETVHAERIYQNLLPFRDQAVTVPACTLCSGSVARYLGLLAGALGDWPAAEEHFEYALQMNERMQGRPWLAHTRREYAVMLAARDRRGDKVRAAGLLAAASATASELNMFALIERINNPAGGFRPAQLVVSRACLSPNPEKPNAAFSH